MSDHSHTTHTVEKFDMAKAGNLPKTLLTVGVGGLAVSGLTAFFNVKQFAHSYLFAVVYFFLVCVGCFFWNCLHHATDSEWSVVIRRQVENVASLLKWFALLMIPVLLVGKQLYPWWNEAERHDPLYIAKQAYLNFPFLFTRFAIFFLLLGGISYLLRKNSIAQDSDGSVARTISMRKLGIVGIPALAVCVTFFGYDYLIGMMYKWFSTMWGVYLFAGAAGSSMALLVIITTWLREKGYLKPMNMEHYHTMGKFMLAFTIFWAYIGFSQYMLIWYANIPEETIYYQNRNTGTWWFLSLLLVFGRFFFIFPILLFQGIKKQPKRLCWVAYWMLGMELLDIFVIVMPQLHGGGFTFGSVVMSIFPLVGIGGLLGFLYFKNLGSAAVFPTRDPRLEGSFKVLN